MHTFLIGAGCLLISVALYKSAYDYTVDASTVRSMMIGASVFLFAASIFIFGMVVGQLIL